MTKAWNQRQRVWRHNSFIGMAVMMRKQAFAIFGADSPSQEAKNLAQLIVIHSVELEDELRKTRIDP